MRITGISLRKAAFSLRASKKYVYWKPCAGKEEKTHLSQMLPVSQLLPRSQLFLLTN